MRRARYGLRAEVSILKRSVDFFLVEQDADGFVKRILSPVGGDPAGFDPYEIGTFTEPSFSLEYEEVEIFFRESDSLARFLPEKELGKGEREALVGNLEDLRQVISWARAERRDFLEFLARKEGSNG